jgi:hypothetical protein
MVYILRAHTHYPRHEYNQQVLGKLLQRFCTSRIDTQHAATTAAAATRSSTYKTLIQKIPSIFKNSKVQKRHFLLSHHDLQHIYESDRFKSMIINKAVEASYYGYRGQGIGGAESSSASPLIAPESSNTTVDAATSSSSSKATGLLDEAETGIRDLLNSMNMTVNDIHCLVSTTEIHCTPSPDTILMNRLQFPLTSHRIFMNGAASGGGAKVLQTAYTYLKANPTHCVMTVCMEAASHGWLGDIAKHLHNLLTKTHAEKSAKTQLLNDIVVSCILGDGVGVCLLVGQDHPLVSSLHDKHPNALKVVDTFTFRLPNSKDVIQRIPMSSGYRSILHPNLPDIVSNE